MSPFVSIIIVNFNGRHLLEECLSSLKKQTYPARKFETIVVDNNSTDDSVPFIRSNYPDVHLILSNSNLGFTGGNNLGYQHARGEYIILLNSDVAAEPDWLRSLVRAADDKKVGIVSSRLRFSIPFIDLSIHSKIIAKSLIDNSIDHSPIGIFIEDVLCDSHSNSSLVYYKSGFRDKKEGEVVTRRIDGEAHIMLPFELKHRQNEYSLTIHGYELADETMIPVSLYIGKRKVFSCTLRPFETKQIKLKIEKERLHEEDLVWHVQNAGNVILHNGNGKDRGSTLIVSSNERREFYEEESAYFNKKVKLLAACGAACLIKRKVIDHIGFLDGHYFMYYEDDEFSVRAFRAGWDIVYAPNAVGYHKHRSTTGGSETAFFLELVERNHLAFVLTHFSVQTAMQELTLFVMRFFITAIKKNVFQFRDNLERSRIWRIKYEGRKAALFFLFRSFIRLMYSRFLMDRNWPIDRNKMEHYLY